MRAGAVQMGAGVPHIYIIYTLMMVPMGNPWVNLSDFLLEIFHQFRVCSGYCADGAKSSDRHKHVKIIDSLYLQNPQEMSQAFLCMTMLETFFFTL